MSATSEKQFSYYRRRKDGVIFSYPNKGAAKRPNDFELFLTKADKLRVNTKGSTDNQFELDEQQRNHQKEMMDRLEETQKVNQALVEKMDALQTEFNHTKKEGAKIVDFRSIIECEAHASALSKSRPEDMTKEQLIYCAYHRFGAEFNPYISKTELNKEYKNLSKKSSPVAGSSKALDEFPKGAVIKDMDIEELKAFSIYVFDCEIDTGLGSEVAQAQVEELKKYHYPEAD